MYYFGRDRALVTFLIRFYQKMESETFFPFETLMKLIISFESYYNFEM